MNDSYGVERLHELAAGGGELSAGSTVGRVHGCLRRAGARRVPDAEAGPDTAASGEAYRTAVRPPSRPPAGRAFDPPPAGLAGDGETHGSDQIESWRRPVPAWGSA
jgi:hypothetical protein